LNEGDPRKVRGTGGLPASGRGKPVAAGEGPKQAAGASDPQLVEEARQGSHAAFEELVRRYSERAFRAAYRVVRNTETAEEVLQEAFLKAYRALRRFECRSSFYTWLYRIVVNLALDRRRRDRPGATAEWDDRVAGEVDPRASIPEAEDPERAAQRREVRELVARGIEQLPDGQREVILLREVEGLSYEEIAATMGISKGTVMSRLHYARRKMVSFLRQHGLDPEDPE
jgi:RNA polymerase sigma-70 factor (ECF subfamily)